MRSLVSLGVALALSTASLTAAAYGDGATGYSGKQGSTCNNCHSGGTAPTVTITGPTSLAAGATGDFTFVVETNEPKAGAGIAASAGSFTAGTGLQEEDGELTHTSGQSVSGGKYTFTFKLTAPTTGTSVTIFAAGLASNGSGTGGDKAAATTKDIAITGGGPGTPAPPSTPTSASTNNDAPTTDTTESSTSSTTKSPSSKKTKTSSSGDDDDDSAPPTPEASGTQRALACSAVPGSRASAAGGLVGLLFGLALIARRRR